MRLEQPTSDSNVNKAPDYVPMHYDEQLRLIVPDDFDINTNAEWAKQHPLTSWQLATTFVDLVSNRYEHGKWDVGKSSPLLSRVKNHGDMDYKRDNHPFFQGLGNYNFGYVAYYAGISLTAAKAFGGLAQILAGTSKLAYVWSGFDDPTDRAQIERGWMEAGEADRAAVAARLMRTLDLEFVTRLAVPLQDVQALPALP